MTRKFNSSRPVHQAAPDPANRPNRGAAELLRPRAPLDVEGLYLHVPFCFHKCHYCDFYSVVDDDRHAAFVRRLAGELAGLGELTDSSLRTVFIGGGTPTLLSPDLLRRVLAAVGDAFDLTRCEEWTVEANPETIDAGKAAVMRAAGVNRLSIGAQSFDPRHLRTLERWHDPSNVRRAVELTRAAGIDNISLDLIFGVPGQSLDDWRADLDAALALRPDHLSCYDLTYEPNTAMTKKRDLGRLEPIDEQLETQMFEATIAHLTAAGYVHYEISNFARRSGAGSRRCRHNLLYWEGGNWLAAGPGASGHVAGLRWTNAPRLGDYLDARAGAPACDVEELDADLRLGEQLMMRLRLIDGVPLNWLAHVLDQPRCETMDRLVDAGLLERTSTHVRLTRRGLLIADSVVGELL